MNIPASLERLIQELSRLPGVGQKTAQRLAFGLLKDDAGKARRLAEAILEVKQRIRFCELCSGYAEEARCSICTDPRRDRSLICVVEQPNDIYVIERSAVFRGRYHVLMGSISPLDGVGPDQLRIRELVDRVDRPEEGVHVQEVILATNPSIPGEATALHLSQVLAGKVPRITRLARGMPVGANLEYTDDVTLNQAFAGRQSVAG
jgi:recombination protein RecR